MVFTGRLVTGSWTEEICSSAACHVSPSRYTEQLPSGSWRAKVYAGKNPLSGRELRFRKTRKTEVEAQIELGKLLAFARSGRQPQPWDVFAAAPGRAHLTLSPRTSDS